MPDGSTGTCKDCGAPLKWVNRNGRWIPLEPRSDKRHRCNLEQTCHCGAKFKGSPWMKDCPECYKRGRTASNRPQEPASPPRKRERLKEDPDDDVPF